MFDSENEYLTAADRIQCDKFVDEYLFDHNIRLAIVRMGFVDEDESINMAKMFWNKPYVQKEIARRMSTPQLPETAKDTEKSDKERIKAALFREAHYFGPGSSQAARVNALSRLCSIYGMDAAKTVNSNVNHQGNVLIVPGISNISDWEQQAIESQQKLSTDVRH